MNRTNDQRIQDQVDQTLEAFDIEVPPPEDPWFFDRLTNRITHESINNGRNVNLFFQGILKPTMLTGLVALNVFMMVWIFKPGETSTSSRMTYIESLSEEYGLNYTDTYLLSESGE